MAFTFLRWMRSGLAAALGDAPASAAAGGRATLTVGVDVGASGGITQTATLNLAVLGPGDVTGVDRRQVIRCFPEPETPDFEPTGYAHVEFDRPDLPWLFTPFGPDASGRLRPWLCLLVVKPGADAQFEPTLPLPRLTLQGSERALLPDPAELHRWAHVQVTGSTATGVEAIAAHEPARILSRLIAARTLEPRTAYLACLVPTFRAGALTGLGRSLPATMAPDAWTAADTTVELPVYHHWRFSTGGDGDFGTLVARLTPRNALPGVGTRAMDMRSPGYGLADQPNAAPLPMGGVLSTAQPVGADAAIARALEGVLGRAGLAPPIYGRWHAAVNSVTPSGIPTRWPDALNLDARRRVAAGLGTLVVQAHQEDLMAAAWAQFGEILRANQLLRQAQVAVAASERILSRHLAALPDGALLAVASPALGRVPMVRGGTARAAVAASCLPMLALSGAFRRVTRVRGPIERRLRPATLTPGFPDRAPPPAFTPASLVDRLASGALNLRPARPPAGAVMLPPRLGYRWRNGLPPGSPPYETPTRPAGPLERLAGALGRLVNRSSGRACRPLDATGTADTLRAALEPDVAIVDRVLAQLSLPASPRLAITRRLDPVMAAPQIPTPMLGPLLDIDPSFLLPGLEQVPANTVTLVQPDAAFIESYMVGLNHEMGRELLWRGFPTDQRGTVFAHFWDRRGAVGTATDPVPGRDIDDVHTWNPATPLGSHLRTSGGSSPPTVLLVRGDLLVRYPRATVFAQRARWVRDAAGVIAFADGLARREPVPLMTAADWTMNTRFPQFTQRSGADTAFYGFALDLGSLRGLGRRGLPGTATDSQAGWYLVFQEQPTQPRFGPASPPTASETSERLAERLVRPAVRLFVHASDLIAP